MFGRSGGYIFLFLLPIIRSLATAEDNPLEAADSNGNNTRIVGGIIATNRTQFAYQASLRHASGNGHFCGGSILDAQHILTAAHCVVDDYDRAKKASTMRVVVGDLTTTLASITTQTRNIKYVFVHEKYNSTSIQNDIALLRIDGSFEFSIYVNSIPLATRTPASNTECIVSGWGTTYSGATQLSSALRYVAVPTWTVQQCNSSYAGAIRPGMLCAGYPDGGKDACQGDSGGPLACNGTQAGIVSWGYLCATVFPGVYTDVSHYGTWIQTQVERDGSNTIFLNLYLIPISIYTYFHLF